MYQDFGSNGTQVTFLERFWNPKPLHDKKTVFVARSGAILKVTPKKSRICRIYWILCTKDSSKSLNSCRNVRTCRELTFQRGLWKRMEVRVP